jgi:hypothetical protein
MTRLLVFDGPRGAKRFQLLWAALTAGGDGKGDRSPAVIRKEARLQEIFERISEPVGETDRQLAPAADGAPTAVVSQEDFDLLQQYTERVPWNPRFSRDIVDLWDFVSACRKQE